MTTMPRSDFDTLTLHPAAEPVQRPVRLRVAPHPIGSRVEIMVGGYRHDTGTVSDVRHGLHFLSMDSGITLGGYTAWQLEAVK